MAWPTALPAVGSALVRGPGVGGFCVSGPPITGVLKSLSAPKRRDDLPCGPSGARLEPRVRVIIDPVELPIDLGAVVVVGFAC